jgi:CheY-like chemotaxis protein
VKQHPQFGGIPVILMSGVVNKTVADRAVSVQADELIRKPFQPQELIGRVKSLLAPKSAPAVPADRPTSHGAPTSLSNLFTPPTLAQSMSPNAMPPAPPEQRASDSAWPRALADAFIPKPAFPPPSAPPAPSFPPNPAPTNAGHASQPLSPSQSFPGALPSTPPAAANPAARPPITADVLRLRAEIARLDLLVKKLQTELQIERQYNQALESQLQNLTRCE